MSSDYRERLKSFFAAASIAKSWMEKGAIDNYEYLAMVERISKKYCIKKSSLYCLIDFELRGNITH